MTSDMGKTKSSFLFLKKVSSRLLLLQRYPENYIILLEKIIYDLIKNTRRKRSLTNTQLILIDYLKHKKQINSNAKSHKTTKNIQRLDISF